MVHRAGFPESSPNIFWAPTAGRQSTAASGYVDTTCIARLDGILYQLPRWMVAFFGKLSQAGGPETFSIRSTSPDAEDGVQEFIYRRPGSTPTRPTRLVQWLKEDDGYRLVQRGEPLQFEQPGQEACNPIPTRRDLLSFVRDFGIDLENEEFWKSDADAIYLSQVWLRRGE
jgi:hypothetical protein